MKKILLFLIIGFPFLSGNSIFAKKAVSHEDLNSWETITNNVISDNGSWVVYTVSPQEGDGNLFFRNVNSEKEIIVPRGSNPSFMRGSDWGVSLIKPTYQENREAEKNGTKNELNDSLCLIDLVHNNLIKIGHVVSYKTAKKNPEWVAWLSNDTIFHDEDDDDSVNTLCVRRPGSERVKTIKGIEDYEFSETGDFIVLHFSKTDEEDNEIKSLGILSLPDTTVTILDEGKKFYGNTVFNREATRLAFIATNDSNETGTKICNLYLADLKDPRIPVEMIEMNFQNRRLPHFKRPNPKDSMEEEWMAKNNENRKDQLVINQYSKPEFSYNGKRLIVGVAPVILPDDTLLLDSERPGLEIWRWDSPYIPPQENSMIKQLREKGFPVVIDLETGTQVLVTDNDLVNVVFQKRMDADWVLLEDPSEHIVEKQWDFQFPVNLSVKNIVDGTIKEVATVKNELYDFSACGKFVIWYDNRQYYTYEIETGKIRLISESLEGPLWDVSEEDLPLKEREPYGIMGWTADDRRVLIYDKWDVWALDPLAVDLPVCITGGYGKKNNIRFRLIQTDPELYVFEKDRTVLYSIFSYKSKENGLSINHFALKSKAPNISLFGGWRYNDVLKSADKEVFSWIQGNFETSPNLYVSTDLFKGIYKRISDTNPQMKDFSWGNVSLYNWINYEGTQCEGLLYLPEDFSYEKEYPMIVYFYQSFSENLYRHFNLEPSWSWINIPFYVSRGYVVFVPDVKFKIGLPGESSYNYVCSGVENLCKEYPNINKSKIGIDGQSWGGYQVAYLITRTDMFACACAGAPVVNMTSAYGGLRWDGGDSRQSQYEQGQSRIGTTLWQNKELYIANSPLFYADRINTPLLIMHNDADGAVPWYQGIEFFMALRRLGKPVWMLQYLGEKHNLQERRNCKDITIRLQQFFDHYLKGDKMPEWMKSGINPLRKGQEFGY